MVWLGLCKMIRIVYIVLPCVRKKMTVAVVLSFLNVAHLAMKKCPHINPFIIVSGFTLVLLDSVDILKSTLLFIACKRSCVWPGCSWEFVGVIYKICLLEVLFVIGYQTLAHSYFIIIHLNFFLAAWKILLCIPRLDTALLPSSAGIFPDCDSCASFLCSQTLHFLGALFSFKFIHWEYMLIFLEVLNKSQVVECYSF